MAFIKFLLIFYLNISAYDWLCADGSHIIFINLILIHCSCYLLILIFYLFIVVVLYYKGERIIVRLWLIHGFVSKSDYARLVFMTLHVQEKPWLQ